MPQRSSLRARARDAERQRSAADRRSSAATAGRLGQGLFGVVVIVVLAVGGYLAFGDFLRRAPAAPGAIAVQSSMAGFTPSEIRVKAGQGVALDWWTDDSALHLEGGVHTLISPEIGLYEELPAEGRRLVSFQAPEVAGEYDVYCDTCCGGRASPSMHGTIVVQA